MKGYFQNMQYLAVEIDRAPKLFIIDPCYNWKEALNIWLLL